MRPGRESRAADELLLKILDLTDHEGLSCKQIAARFGLSKGAVIGLIHRVRNAPVGRCRCRRRANRDGGIKRRWWAA
jgi:transposase